MIRKKKIKITVEYDYSKTVVTDEQLEKALAHFANMLKGSNCSLYSVKMRCLDYKFMNR